MEKTRIAMEAKGEKWHRNVKQRRNIEIFRCAKERRRTEQMIRQSNGMAMIGCALTGNGVALNRYERQRH